MRRQELHPRTAVINKAQKNLSKKSKNQALIWLCSKFPQAFDNTQRIRPLKTGIMDDIMNHADEAALAGISKSKLREAVVIFTRRLDYLACLKAREIRVDLEGNPSTQVTDDEAERAALKIKKRIEKSVRNARKSVTGKSAAPLSPMRQEYSKLSPSYGNYLANENAHAYERPIYGQASAPQSVKSAADIVVKHKTTRQYDPDAVARLKEKLGLSRKEDKEIIE